ncbi:MAG TPA: YraN family protein [Candidatus Methylomirabilis sp.]|nr:YraN family protein [Candidatus Methylomirabilis sp.]
MVTGHRQALGRQGETAARDYLTRRGLRILVENFTCAAGEVDLIGRERGVLVFIEVKARTSNAFGPPHLAVHRRKQRQIVRAAQWYLAEQRTPDAPSRFDVLAVTFRKDGGPPRIDWVKDAFPAEGVEVW